MDELTILAARRFLAVTRPQPCHTGAPSMAPLNLTSRFVEGNDSEVLPSALPRLPSSQAAQHLSPAAQDLAEEEEHDAEEEEYEPCWDSDPESDPMVVGGSGAPPQTPRRSPLQEFSSPASLGEFSSPASHGSTPSGSPCSPGAADHSADAAAGSAALSPHQQQLAFGIRSSPRLRMQGTTSAVAGSTPLSSPSPTPAVAAQEHKQRNRDGLSVVFTATATARPKVYQAQQARRLKEKMAKVEEVLVHMGSRKPVWVRAFKLCVSLAQSPAELSHVVSSFDAQNERSTDDGILSIKKVYAIRCFGGGDVWGV